MINLQTRRITPCTPKVFNEKLSESLKTYYDKARKLVEKRKYLVAATLDGVVYVFVNSYYGGITRRVLGLHVHDGGFKAYKGMTAASKVYSAFMKNDGASLMSHILKHGHEIKDAENILCELKDFGVNINVLPEKVVSKLALAKLLE